MFLAYGEWVPRVGADVYVHPSAQVIGNVELADGAVVLPGAVVRADADPIVLGPGAVVEDACVLHADEGGLRVGARTVIGHGAIVHGLEVGPECLVGMGATLLARSAVGAGCLVGAGALVCEGVQVAPGSLVVGFPAKVRGPVSAAQQAYIAMAADYYRDWGAACRAGALREVEPLRLD
jgi:carbonic anhydrase/acetyltransferase-like protein (isoleucine patch superfamily)